MQMCINIIMCCFFSTKGVAINYLFKFCTELLNCSKTGLLSADDADVFASNKVVGC